LKRRHSQTKTNRFSEYHGKAAYLIERNVPDYFDASMRVSNYWAPLTDKYGKMVGAVAL